MLENVKQQLAEVTVRSHRIEQEQEKKSALRHNKQMEDIRNRHVSLINTMYYSLATIAVDF